MGHFICSSCRGKHLDNKCHICSTKTTFKRCFGMEHVVQSIKVPCSNAMYGCTKMVPYYQREEHDKVCPIWGCFCPVSDCTFLGTPEGLLDHLTTEHEIPFTTLPDSDTTSLRLQTGLHVVQRNGASYFFLLRLALLTVGHAISIICVQPSTTEPKFTCNMNYDCFATGFSESSSCHIRSSSFSEGFPAAFDLILPKGKTSDDRGSIMLRITIHQALSVSRSSLDGKGPTPALQPKTLLPKGPLPDGVPLSFEAIPWKYRLCSYT